jgi:hypothetical protein
MALTPDYDYSRELVAPFKTGTRFQGKAILDAIRLSNGWIIVKTENTKSGRDFRVKTVYQLSPTIRSYTPKHAHFAIDFYGKLCANEKAAEKVFQAIIDVWKREPVINVLGRYESQMVGLPGYPLEYILHALNWILEQEDINFVGRPNQKQEELDKVLRRLGIAVPPDRLGSELAISLFCSILLGEHPVNAFIRANLDVLPVKRARGAI